MEFDIVVAGLYKVLVVTIRPLAFQPMIDLGGSSKMGYRCYQ